jgi:hypothetical protein
MHTVMQGFKYKNSNFRFVKYDLSVENQIKFKSSPHLVCLQEKSGFVVNKLTTKPLMNFTSVKYSLLI